MHFIALSGEPHSTLNSPSNIYIATVVGIASIVHAYTWQLDERLNTGSMQCVQTMQVGPQLRMQQESWQQWQAVETEW